MNEFLRTLFLIRQNPETLLDYVVNILKDIENIKDSLVSEEGLIFLKGIAKAAYDQGLYDVAEYFYDMAMDVCRDIRGENSLDCAIIYNDAALVQEKKGNIESARILYSRCLKILKKQTGKSHPFTKIVKRNLSSLK